jgi:recombination protein RecA
MDKEIIKTLELLDEGNPFSSFLNNSTLSKVDKWIDTGSYVLNAIVSGKIKDGGIPNGRVTMLYGESMTFKSSLVQKILANAQKQGLIPVIFDTENAIDPEGAERLGLDTSKVKYVPVFNVEQCRNSLYKFLTAVKEKGMEGKFIIAIDSLGNLESAMETNRMEKDSTSMDMGTRARAIKTLLRTATQLAAITKTPIIITNHLYDNPGEMHPSLVKNMPGGKACVYMPSVSIQLMRKPVKEDAVKSEEGKLATLQRNYVGIIIRALTAKNRFQKQYLEGELYISFNSGVAKYHGMLDIAVGLGIIEQSGATYSFNGEKLGYAKSFQNDTEFWENKIIPLIEEKIKVEWAYSNSQETITDDDDPDDDIEE